MKSSLRPIWGIGLCLLLVIMHGSSDIANAQERKKPIDIDVALQEEVPQNLAMSYYHYALAKWHEVRGEMADALSEMRTALKYNGVSSTLRVDLASILYAAGDIRGCVREAEEASRLDPQDPSPHWLLANVYLTPQDRSGSVSKETYQKAVKELEMMRELAPEDERAYYTLGKVYFELEEPAKAIEAYEKFQSLVPNTDYGYNEIAKYYEKIGNQGKKIEYLNKALKNQPESAANLVKLADSYANLNQTREAIPLYRKALELSGNNRVIQRRLASSLIDVGEFGEAGRILEGLSGTESRDPAVELLLGRARLGERRFKEAIRVFEEILQDNPDNLEVEFYQANATVSQHVTHVIQGSGILRIFL